MKIRYLTHMATAVGSIAPGDCADVAAAEAARLIEAGFAKRVSKTGGRVFETTSAMPAPETTAAAPAPETTAADAAPETAAADAAPEPVAA